MKFENLVAAFKETARREGRTAQRVTQERDQQYKEQLKELQDQRVKLLERQTEKRNTRCPRESAMRTEVRQ